MEEHRVRIFFEPKTADVLNVVEVLERKSIPHTVADFKVERFDASGQFHMATIVTISAAAAFGNIEPISEVLKAYITADRGIKITMPGASFKVANEAQLLEAVEAVRQLQGVG